MARAYRGRRPHERVRSETVMEATMRHVVIACLLALSVVATASASQARSYMHYAYNGHYYAYGAYGAYGSLSGYGRQCLRPPDGCRQ
jgi:hypothetical protein